MTAVRSYNPNPNPTTSNTEENLEFMKDWCKNEQEDAILNEEKWTQLTIVLKKSLVLYVNSKENWYTLKWDT